ncbi:DEAD/DEAH box helicase [Mycoplasma sp. CSL10166]|uniref:SNF2-related protein n=1 Tax=Mycoplasma sp. CSL10166 TaxID=2813825 RepID=UPI00197B7C29|nr:DEAD/DEAH box helicase [Mycoplasma sp. CSL10166]MBN4084085.1 DEAD/DEAH box helicase [Mycoplasma sp. CSL10166]
MNKLTLTTLEIKNNLYKIVRTNGNINHFTNSKTYKRKFLKKFFDWGLSSLDENYIVVKENFSNNEIENLIENIKKSCTDINYTFEIDKSIEKTLEQEKSIITKRKNVGIDIKNNNFSDLLLDEFNNFKIIIKKYLIRELKPKQLLNSFFGFIMKNSLNYSVPGAGKTSSTLAIFSALFDKGIAEKIIVIAPKNSFESWINEWKNTFGNNIELKEYIYEGTKSKVQNFWNKNLILLNYEKVFNFKEHANKVINKKTFVIFDEVHKIKNPDGVRSQEWIKIILGNQNCGIIQLTGTPLPNTYKDIFVSAKMMFSKELKDFFPYSVEELEKISENNNISKMKIVNQDLYPFFIRTSKKDLKILPPLKDKFIEVEATPDEILIFKEINKNIKNGPEKLIRFMQLESNPKMLAKTIEDDDILDSLELSKNEMLNFNIISKELVENIYFSSKFKKMFELVRSLVFERKKVIVWCIFKDTINTIYDFLNQNNIKTVKIHGEVEDQQRTLYIKGFKEGRYDVIVTNPHTLAESVSFHKISHDAIYYDLSYNLVHYLQSKNRIHRLGLTNDEYTQYHFISQNYNLGNLKYNLIEKIYKRLLQKEEIMNEAVESQHLETQTFSSSDDILKILEDLK